MKSDKDPNRKVETTAISETENEIIATTSPTVTKTEDEETITIENNEDFKALLNSEYLSADAQNSFARKYKNRIVEFDCFVYYMQQNSKYKTIYSYIFAPGESDNLTGAVLFGLEDASAATFKWDSKTRPDYLTVGSKIRLRAEIQGATDLYIKLKPVYTWGR